MHIFFLDESGTPPGSMGHRDKYFVIGGVIIPDTVWHRIKDALLGMKARRKISGEIKWRYFAPNNDDLANPMREMDWPVRNEIRAEMYQIMCSVKSIRTMACVACIDAAYEMNTVSNSDDLYHSTYKPLSERFQYYLQDLSRSVGRLETGIIVADHRGARDDDRFRTAHEQLLNSGTEFASKYSNLIESLFFQPSNLSVGIQFADMVAGAVWRKFEKDDDRWYRAIEPSLRKSPEGRIDGYGVVKFPKKTWK